jgi:2-polyprenyl-3-methyl-5-hydroxy-6-metoxy-1,4-benzoquinol methylase
MDDEQVWSDFLEFVGRAPAARHPGLLFDGLRLDLIERGVPDDVAAARMGRVIEMSRQRSDWAGPMFDRIYLTDQPEFRLEPNEFVERMTVDRAPGTALDVAMGQGRNAVHLARRGWRVTGFDLSAAGLAQANAAAVEHGVAVETVLASAEEFAFGSSRWDLIVMTYAVVPVTSAGFAATIADALRPGGLVVIESFAAGQGPTRRPVDLDPTLLRTAYGGLHEVAFEVETAVADWTLVPEPIVRLAAQRPG